MKRYSNQLREDTVEEHFALALVTKCMFDVEKLFLIHPLYKFQWFVSILIERVAYILHLEEKNE